MMQRLLAALLLIPTLAFGQSRDFNSGETLSVDSVAANLNDHTYTMVCWAAPDASFATNYAFSVGDKDVTNEYVALGVGVASGNIQGDLEVVTATSGTINTTSAAAADDVDWYLLHGYSATASSRSVQYIKEYDYTVASSGSDTTPMSAPGTYDRTIIGETADSSPSNSFDGKVAWCAVWDIGSRLAQTGYNLRLAMGGTPAVIWPNELLGFWRMDGDGTDGQPDLSQNANDLTTTDTISTSTDAPPYWYPAGGN